MVYRVFRLWVIRNMVRLRVLCRVWIRLLKVVVLIGLRLVVGLLRNRMFGFSVRVWVRVVCLIMLLESEVGYLLLVLVGSLVRVSLIWVRCLVLVCGRLVFLISGRVMFFIMVSEENSVFCWNSMLKCCLIREWCFFGSCSRFLLNICMLLEVGWCRLMMLCSSIDLLVLELLIMLRILL